MALAVNRKATAAATAAYEGSALQFGCDSAASGASAAGVMVSTSLMGLLLLLLLLLQVHLQAAGVHARGTQCALPAPCCSSVLNERHQRLGASTAQHTNLRIYLHSALASFAVACTTV
jgi:hypothetical protein